MKITPKIFYVLIFVSSYMFSQNTTHEIGVLTGTAALQTDYGLRGDMLSTTANNSTSFTIAHYMQLSGLSQSWNKRSSILDHIIIKSEFNYIQSVDLRHPHVKLSPKTILENKTRDGNQTFSSKEVLGSMKGNISLMNLGFQLEYYLKDLTEFFNGTQQSRFNPFFNFGFNYSLYSNSVTSDLGDWHTDKSLLPEKYRAEGAIKEGKGGALGFNTGVGSRYRLSEKLDIVAQFKWEIYTSDSIDGLQANVVENKSNETLTNLQVGLIYHLNFSKR
ncbi:MAG: hypothetical protein HWD85_11645 [Flavobacteriaceae bacterium]|nr:hypothetical protein [Flavobacteriaceae bacterium]